ncbi:leucyl aminopeptidase [Gammaproteobacteria bacterium]|nr:leucyl aminopeptidase [Gammaproteobacteria bacterium]
MKYNIKLGAPENSRTPCIVAGVFEKGVLSPSAKRLDKASGGYIKKVIKRGDLSGHKHESLLLQDLKGVTAARILLVGLGAQRSFKEYEFAETIGFFVRKLKDMRVRSALVCILEVAKFKKAISWKSQKLIESIENELYDFQYLKGKTKNKSVNLTSIDVLATKEEMSAVSESIEKGLALSLGIKKAKDLGNLPGNICTPNYLADQAKDLAKKYKAIRVKILDEKEIEKLGMGAFMSVTKGSDQPGKLITISYKGSTKKDPVHAVIGKGITFDTGGISLKPGAGMHEMIWDMCGAATAFGTVLAVAESRLPMNLLVVLAAAENMPSGSASRPGDIVTSMSGQTVEILNTDAEGRLVLCDALTYVERFQPETVIDVATLTGACVIALGSHATAMYSNDDNLAKDLIKSGENSLDRVWQMPLWKEYQSQINSTFADMANIGGREAGSITAACFLSRFAENHRWAHLDVAGTAFNGTGAKKGATGRPVPLLFDYLSNIALNG